MIGLARIWLHTASGCRVQRFYDDHLGVRRAWCYYHRKGWSL